MAAENCSLGGVNPCGELNVTRCENIFHFLGAFVFEKGRVMIDRKVKKNCLIG